MSNEITEGRIVKCIVDSFPLLATTESDKSNIGSIPANRPNVGDYYQVREILGDFLSFDHLNTDGKMNWWKADRFRLATIEELEGFGLGKIANGGY